VANSLNNLVQTLRHTLTCGCIAVVVCAFTQPTVAQDSTPRNFSSDFRAIDDSHEQHTFRKQVQPTGVVNSEEDDDAATERRLRQLEAEIAEIRSRVSKNAEPSAVQSASAEFVAPYYPVPPAPEGEPSDGQQPVCDVCPPGYTLQPLQKMFGTTDSLYPTIDVGGFIQLDSGWFIQEDANTRAVGDIENKTGLRRVRVKFFGDIREDTSYLIDLDFAASGHPSFRDVVLQFEDVPYVQNLRVGYFQQPFQMNALTSGQHLDFMERLLPFAFAPFRKIGLSEHGTTSDERTQWAVSAYRFPTNDFGQSEGDSGGYALAARLTHLPVYRNEGEQLVHVGLGYSLGDPGDNMVQYKIQPSFFVTDNGGSTNGGIDDIPVFVDTGPIRTNTYNLFNAEMAVNCGPFHVQSEATFSVVDQMRGPTLGFWGAYAFAGYFLTGETRPYDRQEGVFTLVDPDEEFTIQRGGLGAWSVAAGWSFISLNDENIAGGKMNSLIFGLNWYQNSLVRVMFNYTYAFLDDPTVGGNQAQVFGVRTQVRF